MQYVKPQETRDYARAASAQVDVVRLLRERYGVSSLVVDGDEIRCSCPLPFGMHPRGDRNPSFSVNAESRLVNCYVCGGGDMLWFIQNMEPRQKSGDFVSYADVARIANEYAEEFDIDRVINGARESSKSALSGWRVPDRDISDFDVQVSEWSKHHTSYWRSRGLNKETVDMWRLGFDEQEQRAIVPHVFDGRVVGWTGRSTSDEVLPKWKHSYQFPKDTTLFNYDNARRYPQVVVVEAPISALWLWQSRIPNVVATFGASVTMNQERLLRQFDEVILWMDADKAGWKSTLSLCENLRGHCIVGVVDSWEGDPAEKSADECWGLLYEKGLIPGFMFESSLIGNVDRVSLDGIYKVRKSRTRRAG
jgi:DNA primase